MRYEHAIFTQKSIGLAERVQDILYLIRKVMMVVMCSHKISFRLKKIIFNFH